MGHLSFQPNFETLNLISQGGVLKASDFRTVNTRLQPTRAAAIAAGASLAPARPNYPNPNPNPNPNPHLKTLTVPDLTTTDGRQLIGLTMSITTSSKRAPFECARIPTVASGTLNGTRLMRDSSP